MFPIAPMAESQDRLRSDRQKEDIHDKNKDAKDYLNKIETPHIAWSDSDALNHFNNPVCITAMVKLTNYQESQS